MADRAHSSSPSTIPNESQLMGSQEHAVPKNPTPPGLENPIPPSPEQIYFVEVPRDQVIRVPPPENARRIEQYARQRNRRSPCCRFLCCLVILAPIIGIGVVILNLTHLLKAGRYTVDHASIHGTNLTSTESQAISLEFDIALRAENLNSIFGIHYQKHGFVEVYYKELRLVDGTLPAFYQPSNNVTVFHTALKGSGIVLSSTDAKALVDEQNKGSVQLTLRLKAPVKLKAGPVETWEITVKANCHITVDSLTALGKVVSNNCHNGVQLWG